MNEEVILYLKTADGETMAVPESKLEDFRILNEKIKARMQQNAKTSQENSSKEDTQKK